MLKRISVFIIKETHPDIPCDRYDPYHNLAVEEYLFHHVDNTQLILYLWQNEKTVVIGRNQNPWKECRIKELEKDGGKLVRRLSGGGAVFHDLGNLNFTFLAAKENFNVDRQLEVILQTVRRLGMPAERSGRNDITIEGRKFSGNAFYSDGTRCYHHGTILLHVDMGSLTHYLNVSSDKLVSKGVESVRSRVINLTEYMPDLTVDAMKDELIRSFGDVYGMEPELLRYSSIAEDELSALKDKFSSWGWNFGRKTSFSDSISRRYSWGGVDLNFLVDGGVIRECTVYSDALETGIFEAVSTKLTACPFNSKAMVSALQEIPALPETDIILSDIIALIKEKL